MDGNSGPNMINGPAFHSLDLTLARTFPIRERVKFQFRAEASNAFNIVSLGQPGNTVNTATFGVISSASADAADSTGGEGHLLMPQRA